jgi:predicted nucleic acid-binding protein
MPGNRDRTAARPGLSEISLTPEDRNTLLAQYLPYCETVTLSSVWPKLPAVRRDRDRDDAVFIALMLSASADLLVSGDTDPAVPRDTVRVISVTDLRIMLDSAVGSTPVRRSTLTFDFCFF